MDSKLQASPERLPISFKLLKLSVFLVFFGRAYQFLFWDAPFRAFFWDESLLKPFVEDVLAINWHDYVTSVTTDNFIQNITFFFGAVFTLAAIVTLIYKHNVRTFKVIVLSGTTGLIILAYLLMKEQFYRLGQFFEYSLQFGVPIILVYYKRTFIQQHLDLILKILIAIVFVAHAMYAIGYYPVSGYFLDMTINILGFSESTAQMFLLVAGILDILTAILIFVPRVAKYALYYMVVWGFLTAMARLVSGINFDFFWDSVHANLYQMIYRLPHGLIPLMVVFRIKEISKVN